MKRPLLCAALLAGGCATTSNGGNATQSSMRAIALPDAPADGVFMDYLAYDRERHRVWVPAGNTGKVDVVEVPSGTVAHVDGFPTKEVERRGKKRIVGPSSASVGDGVVYVGNRGDSTICAVDAASLQKGACVTLDSMPDGVAWVAATREVWVTTPRDKSITIVDASTPGTLTVKQKMTFEGEPEGYAVDNARGLFYTNLEDKDRTLQIDAKSKTIANTWMPNCGEDGPKGLALDHAAGFLFVACADKVKVLDTTHEGHELSTLATGDGVDNIDYVEPRHELFAGAARAAKLTVAAVDAHGTLTARAVIPTSTGARNPVATDDGTAYLTDSPAGKILVVSRPR
jgi:outer membrane protein assembly factor BamB